MPLDDIVSFVRQEWREALWERPEDLPVMVEIIFTQCYGHLHGQRAPNDRFRVTAFTTADHPSTSSARDVTGTFANYDLTPYARETLREEVARMETWRQSDHDKFVDLSAARSSRDTRDRNLPVTSATEDSVTHGQVR